ncbi:MAG: L-threonylcarbamoyladenylate synthase [Gemmataceae bacterium]
MARIELTTAAMIAQAAELLRNGDLVAFPTETVYGLGANALNRDAVRKIFVAKGRPSNNPIIVHVTDGLRLAQVAENIPDIAFRLAERYWPGPLTLVLPRSSDLPDEVTGGGPTVAVRIPAHPIAQALLAAAQIPVAAPSANRSTGLSPTTAAHVAASLGDSVDLILDGGACPGGIESTVLDVTASPPRILRPGPITAMMIEIITGPLGAAPTNENEIPRSPGQMLRHYAPRTPLEIAPDDGLNRVTELLASQKKVAWLTWPDGPFSVNAIEHRTLPRDPVRYAAGLYAALHDLDAAGCDRIVVAAVPNDPEWLAIRDRLTRAAN